MIGSPDRDARAHPEALVDARLLKTVVDVLVTTDPDRHVHVRTGAGLEPVHSLWHGNAVFVCLTPLDIAPLEDPVGLRGLLGGPPTLGDLARFLATLTDLSGPVYATIRSAPARHAIVRLVADGGLRPQSHHPGREPCIILDLVACP